MIKLNEKLKTARAMPMWELQEHREAYFMRVCVCLNVMLKAKLKVKKEQQPKRSTHAVHTG